jgi:transcriptional regulator with XRE-family HTH domain
MRCVGEGCSASAERPSCGHAASDRTTRTVSSIRKGPAKTRACSPAMGDLGRAIRKLRREHKLTIEALAFAASIHPTYVSSIERGLRNPSWLVLCSLADALQITVVDLVQRVESAERVREGYERVLQDERARLMGAPVRSVQDAAA